MARNLISPVAGRAQGGAGAYGWRTHPVSGARTFHAGLDIACPTGTPIVAPEPGVVVYAGNAGAHPLTRGRTGKCLVLRGSWTGHDWYFGHNDRNQATSGTRVEQGDPLALSGATGNVTGPHVHLEIRPAATTTTTDPDPWLRARGVTPGAPPPTPTPPATTEDDMPKLTDTVTLGDLASRNLEDKEQMTYGALIQYAGASGYQLLKTLPNLEKKLDRLIELLEQR